MTRREYERRSMKKVSNKEFEAAVRRSLRGKQVPILVLDGRWHALFAGMNKPSDIISLENRVNDLLKQQGRLVNEIKDLKNAKKKLMAGIVAGMSEDTKRSRKKKDNQQRLLETNERIQDESDELMEIPSQIKQANEDLLVLGARYLFEQLREHDEILSEVTQNIRELRLELSEKTAFKDELSEKIDNVYSLMHGLFGHDVMNLFDKDKKK